MRTRDWIIAFALVMLAGACIVSIASGQETATPEPAAPPAITSEMRETYFQAKSDVLEAQVALTAAQGRLDASVKGMQAVCPLIVDAQGKPQCAPPVEPEAKP